MHIYPDSIGEVAEDGSIKTEAANCAITGVPVLEQHHTVQRLNGTRYFVRVLSQLYPRLTEAVQTELLASVQSKSARAKAAVDSEKEIKHGD